MKRYNDLTEEQLLELAAIAHDQPATKMLHVDHTVAFNRIVEGENGVLVFFNCQDGTVARSRNGVQQTVYRIFEIVDKCREWGVDYKCTR